MQTIWKGAVSFGLVNVPVKMFTATQDNDIPMKLLHKEYNMPIRYHRTCPKCGENVSWNDIVKGYEYEPGRFVTFEKEELEKLSAEASREIKIMDFVGLDEIDPIYYQKTYYLAPEETGKHAYRLLVEALKATDKVGLAHVTIRSKSSLAAVRVIEGNMLSMVTMFYAEEIRAVDQVPNMPKQAEVDERELEMAKSLIGQLTTEFEPERYKDEFRDRLLAAIEDKVEGKEVKFAPEEKPTNVIDLMAALKASLKSAVSQGDEEENDAAASNTSKKRGSRSRRAAGSRSQADADAKADGRKSAGDGDKEDGAKKSPAEDAEAKSQPRKKESGAKAKTRAKKPSSARSASIGKKAADDTGKPKRSRRTGS